MRVLLARCHFLCVPFRTKSDRSFLDISIFPGKFGFGFAGDEIACGSRRFSFAGDYSGVFSAV